MKVILIGGPHNQKVLDVKAATHTLRSRIDNENVIYEKTPAVISGYTAYRFIKKGEA